MGPWVLLLVGALMVGFLQALTWVHPPRASAATAAAAGEFVPLTQSRVVTSAPVTSGTTSSFQITGTGGVPASVSQVSAVVLTVTAASATASQWVSVWAEGATQPTTTLLTTVIGGSVANTVITKVGATGKVSVALGGGTANISLDVQGYYTTAATTTAAATFVALNHTRAYDTRAASSMGGRTTPLAAGETVTVPMLGQAGIPASGVAAVAVNVTALNTGTVSTFLQVWSGGTRPTNTSNVNAGAGKNASSLVQVAVSATGTISVYNNAATTNLVIDVEGYYKDVAGDAEDFFVPVNQARIYDSRTGLNAGGKTTPVPAKGTAAVPVCGAVALGATVPVPADANVDAVVLSLVVTGATTGGYARVYAEGDDFPTGTAMSWNTGQATTTQTLIAKVGPTGRISVYVSSQVHVVVDVQGYFQKTAIGAPPNPVVSSSVFTAGGWKASGTAGTFSFAAGGTPSPAVTQYRYAFDDASLAAPTVVNVAGNATGTTLSLTPADGWHTLYVQSANSAGNTSGVVAYTFGVGVGITSPKPNTSTGKQVTLSARAASTYGSVTWRWRRSASEPWANILEANVKNGTTAITAWPVTATVSGSSTIAPALTWDLASALGNVDTTVLVSACFTPIGGGTPACNTDASAPSVILDRVNAGGAETDLGIGSLNQLTGNVTLSAGDVNVPVAGSSLSLSRTFNTLAPTKTADAGSGVASIFGQGWTTGLPVDEAGSSWTGLAHRGSTVQVTDVDGFTTTFAKNAAGAWKPTGEDADSGLTLTSATGTAPATFTVSDLDGNTTRFKAATTLGGSPSPTAPNRYVVDIVTQPGSAQTTTYSYDSAGKPTQILAPVPTGSTCTSTTPGTGTWSGACRALLLTYGTTGGAAGKVTAVTLRTTTSAGAEVDVDQACYAYDTNGRLSAAWDPRDGGTVGAGLKPVACSATQYRPTTYTYDATTGRLLTVTPAGLAAYTLWYDTSGRVNRVSRTHTNTTVQRTDIAYDLPVTGDTANPQYRPDLSSTAIAAWGQSEAPATATAVFRPGKNASTSDLRWADVTYMDSAGRTVNTASYSGTGASGWHIDTTDYDDQGNVVRTLSATNREEALNVATAANPALKLPTDTRAAAAALSTVNVYAYDPSTGISDLTDTFGPFHMLSVNGLDTLVGARQHTKTYYDTGSELAHPAGGVLHLPVKVTVGASQSQLPVVTNETDIRTTTTDYALSSTDAAGWTFKAPMKVTTDPTGLAISKVTRYDTATGAVVESRQPNSAATTGADAGTTLTVYYSSAANATDPECGGKAAWATLVCKIKPAAQPPAATGMPGLVSKTFTYDYLSRPTVVTESVPDSAGVVKTRTTTTTYTLSGYGTDVVTVAQTGGLGTALPTVTTTYNATTGLAETVSNGTVTSRTGYDEFGRVVSYKENDTATGAAANTVTTVYDDTTGLVTSTTDAKGTVTNTYNSTTEYRNLVTSMTVSGITGAFSATYDTDGGLATQTWPNGVTQTITDDEAGETTSRNITGSGVTWLSEVLSSTTHGQTFRASYSGAEDYSGRRKYEYDAAGRLKTSYHRLLGPAYGDKGQCTTRTYTLDANGNRTFQRVFNPLSDGACQATTAASTMQHTYDIADRLRSATSDVGLVYDAFGRITTLPSADTADAGGNVTLGYYTNDMVRTQTRGTTTTTYTLDPAGRLATRATSGGATLVNHYDDASSDSPDWIAEDAAGTTWTRNITGLDGNLAATINQAGAITWQVTNAHGDVVATAPDGAVAPSNYYLTDEFGLGVSGWTSPSRYGWLGGKQRPGDTLGGLVLMGVRLYAPVLGRFLSTDPVAGGNENAYNYPNDPVNAFDLDGKSWRSKLWGGVKAAGKFAWKYKSTIGQIAGCAVSIAACAAITAAQFAYRSYKRGSTYGWGRDTWRGIAGDAVMTAATFAIKAPVGRYLKTSGYWRSMSKVRKFGLSTAMGAPGYLHTAAGTYYGMTGRRHWLYNQGGRRSSIGQRLAYQSIYS
ncbi:MAG: RHS repeat-associated core domain-containing protein [Kineosporiaceae bacterium]